MPADPSGGFLSALGLAFSFSPAPLVLNGQTTQPSLVFSEPQVSAQVDQASQAYAFTAGNIQNSFNFLSGVTKQTFAYTTPIFNNITAQLTTLGSGELQALQDAVSKIAVPKQKSGGLLGFLGL